MMTAGRRERLPRALIAIAVFVIFMHVVAFWMVGRYADADAEQGDAGRDLRKRFAVVVADGVASHGIDDARVL